MVPSRKLSIALVVYTTILWISQMTYNVTADGTTAVQDTVPGTSESHEQIASSDIGRLEDTVDNTTSSTADYPGFYQRYKQFVAKHNKTFTIVFGVLFIISLVGGVVACSKGTGNEMYAGILIVFGMIIFVIVICKLSSKKGFTFFRSKKAPVTNTAADATA
uniref:Uncharacterized protein n=1 Tax=Babesia bovis TaxID=5865 RepID=S6C7P2_BABBO|nr:hypothetical protein [Babesia bovis]